MIKKAINIRNPVIPCVLVCNGDPLFGLFCGLVAQGIANLEDKVIGVFANEHHVLEVSQLWHCCCYNCASGGQVFVKFERICR